MSLVESGSLDPALQEAAARLVAGGAVGLALDIDGTLSPIALTPEAAVVPEASRAALKQLVESKHFDVIAVVSGRSATDARQMLGLPGLFYIGNHGLELWSPDQSQPIPVEAAQPYYPMVVETLEIARTRLKGPEYARLLFEDKGVTGSIHYRLAQEPETARQAILAALAAIPAAQELSIREGRMVIELRPPIEVNKGTALTNLKQLFGLRRLIFVGDDHTDVDGFRALRRLETEATAAHEPAFAGLAIGVHSLEMPPEVRENTDFLVENVAGVGRFLSWLAANVMQSNPVETDHETPE